MQRRLTTMTMMLATMLWAGTALAHMRGGGGFGGGLGPEPGMMLPMLLHKLDLTDVQRQQVRTILETHRAKFQTLFPQLRDAQQTLDAKLMSPNPIQAGDLAPQIQQLADLRKQILQEGVAVALEVRGVLTADQRARAATLQSQIAALHAQMRALIGEPPTNVLSDQ